MRMEELSDGRYVKSTDTVERYLLNLVQEYFKNTNAASTTSKEYIIQKAVDRMKEEITFDNIGVLSITLPSGEVKTGAITLTLEDLNGEPLISPKYDAFNVDFGTEQGTACEGNDPRLSDARKPLKHEHNISDIIGLEGTLSTIIGKLNKLGKFNHEHDNKSLLDILVYTGDKTQIDLTVLETLEEKVLTLISDIENDINIYKQEFENKVQEIGATVNEVQSEVNSINQNIISINQDYYNQAKTYADTKIAEVENSMNLSNLVTADMLVDFSKAASDAYTLVGSMRFDLNTVINVHGSNKSYKADKDISSDILNELTNRSQTLDQCQIEVIIEYPETLTSKVYSQLPYVFIRDFVFDGALYVTTSYSDKKIWVVLNTQSGVIPDNVKQCSIIYNVYSKKTVTL